MAATLLVSLSMQAKALTAVLAALPAALMAINTMFRFERKTAWHWKKNKRLEALLRALRYENQVPAFVSQEFSRVEEEMDSEWISFGSNFRSDQLSESQNRKLVTAASNSRTVPSARSNTSQIP
ncbi:MAG: hypothetical protein AB1813_10445 [Verrucomicrobiota bacterium]